MHILKGINNDIDYQAFSLSRMIKNKKQISFLILIQLIVVSWTMAQLSYPDISYLDKRIYLEAIKVEKGKKGAVKAVVNLVNTGKSIVTQNDIIGKVVLLNTTSSKLADFKEFELKDIYTALATQKWELKPGAYLKELKIPLFKSSNSTAKKVTESTIDYTSAPSLETENKRFEAERLEQEKREKKRIKLEQEQKEKLAAEKRKLTERETTENVVGNKPMTLAELKLEKARIEAEIKRLEALEAENKIEQETTASKKSNLRKLEKERIAAEKKKLKEEKLQKERLASEKKEKEKIEAENQRLAIEKLRLEKIEKERLEVERIEKENKRFEQEWLEKEKLEAEKEKVELDRLEQEKIEAEKKKIEQERLLAEKLQKERLEKEKIDLKKQRIENERLAREKIEADKIKLDEIEEKITDGIDLTTETPAAAELPTSSEDIAGCADIQFSKIEIIKKNKKQVVISYELKNEGVGTALLAAAQKNGDNLALRAHLCSSEKLTRGAITLGGSFLKIGEGQEKLQPGETYTGTLKLPLHKLTKFTPFLVLQVDPYQKITECDETNNLDFINLID